MCVSQGSAPKTSLCAIQFCWNRACVRECRCNPHRGLPPILPTLHSPLTLSHITRLHGANATPFLHCHSESHRNVPTCDHAWRAHFWWSPTLGQKPLTGPGQGPPPCDPTRFGESFSRVHHGVEDLRVTLAHNLPLSSGQHQTHISHLLNVCLFVCVPPPASTLLAAVCTVAVAPHKRIQSTRIPFFYTSVCLLYISLLLVLFWLPPVCVRACVHAL
jgi:hypothetical protein